MNTTITQTDGKTIVTLTGRLDTTNAQDFENQISSLFKLESPDIIFECSDFSYISSSGLRIFLLLQKSVIKQKGKLVITHMCAEIRDVFDMTGFSSIFTIE